MSTFKLKPEKDRPLSHTDTLQERHQKKVEMFKKRKQNLPNMKIRLENYIEKLQNINKLNGNTYTPEDIQLKSKLKSKIDELTADIYDIENNISETEYYSKTSDIIMDYYDIFEKDEDSLYDVLPELSTKKSEPTKEKELSALDKLHMQKKGTKRKKKTPKKRRQDDSNQKNIISFFCKDTPVEEIEKPNDVNKVDLSKKYKMMVDNEHFNTYGKQLVRVCDKCGIEKLLKQSEGLYVCFKCGEAEQIIIESERPNYKENVPEKSGYPYKRINHLNECLSQFQAKESTEIPQEVYDQILVELNKNRLVDLKQLAVPYFKLKYMKKILKTLRLVNYYEHATHIISKLSKIPPPTLPRDKEEKIRYMFRQVQAPFQKYCPKARINFLSYSYVLHKFFELLELDEFINCFPLLKSRDKLRQQDIIWEKICEDLRWQFIPSI